MNRVLRLAVSLACSLYLGCAFASEPRTFRLGKMEIAYDPERWSPEPGGEGSVTMRPVGAMAKAFVPVSITRTPSSGIDTCNVLARQELRQDLYEEPTTSPMEIGGLSATQFMAHTRCRNATPMGFSICTYHAGSAYLLSVTIASCRAGGGSPFGPDPLHELVQGMRFIP